MKTEIRYGTRVKEERLNRGWTQEHLAEVADVAVRTLARIEKGEVQGLESLMAIAAAFEIELGNWGKSSVSLKPSRYGRLRFGGPKTYRRHSPGLSLRIVSSYAAAEANRSSETCRRTLGNHLFRSPISQPG